MKSLGWVEISLIYKTGVLINKENLNLMTNTKKDYVKTQRKGGHVTKVMYLEAKECQGLPSIMRDQRGKRGFSPGAV